MLIPLYLPYVCLIHEILHLPPIGRLLKFLLLLQAWYLGHWGRTQYQQPLSPICLCPLSFQATGSRCFFSLGLALILPSAPAASLNPHQMRLLETLVILANLCIFIPGVGFFSSPNRKDHLNTRHCHLPGSEDEAAYQSG